MVPGKGYAPRARHARAYKAKIRGIAQKKISHPFNGEISLRLEYLYSRQSDRLDGDNLLKTVCDALQGPAYNDDSQIVHHDVKLINKNTSYTVRGIPLNPQIVDLFASQEPFAIIRLGFVTEDDTVEQV